MLGEVEIAEGAMLKKYQVTLTADKQAQLREIINKGKHSAQKRKRAQALLLANEGYTQGERI
jgi:hypothetical protein